MASRLFPACLNFPGLASDLFPKLLYSFDIVQKGFDTGLWYFQTLFLWLVLFTS
jgi:hypothetical protein